MTDELLWQTCTNMWPDMIIRHGSTVQLCVCWCHAIRIVIKQTDFPSKFNHDLVNVCERHPNNTDMSLNKFSSCADSPQSYCVYPLSAYLFNRAERTGNLVSIRILSWHRIGDNCFIKREDSLRPAWWLWVILGDMSISHCMDIIILPI